MESHNTIYAAVLLAADGRGAREHAGGRHDDDRARAGSAIRGVRARRRAIALIALVGALVVAGLATAGVAPAAGGDLDPSFDGDGKRVLPFAGIPNEALVQPDGKIVLAGFDENHDFAVWRLNSDGSLDRSFDGDGTVAISFGDQDAINAAALQPDGRIVVAGSTYSMHTRADMAVARLNTNGSLDKTFDPGGPDGDGKKVLHAEGDAAAAAVAVQADGRILLAGENLGAGTFGLTRLTSIGAHDGTVFENPPELLSAAAADAVLQPDGTIVVAGDALSQSGSGGRVQVVARYTPEGSLDETFAGTGVQTLPDNRPAEVLVRPGGEVVVAGIAGYPDTRIAVTQLTRGGAIDTAFGIGGTNTADFDGEDLTGAAVLQPDGKVVVAGIASAEKAFAVARFGATGALDPGFGSAGKTTVVFGADSIGTAAALQPDGKLVVAGATATDEVAQLAVARLLSDAPPSSGGGPVGAPARVTRCAGRRATIVGTAGRDTLRGTPRADVIVALAGNDRVLGRGGNDVVCGGAGNDRLSGGPGRDRLLGERGRDVLTGGRGRDRLIGGQGRDHIRQ